MVNTPLAAQHDAYAADYDQQVQAYGCYVAEVLFGLIYEDVRPGQHLLDLGIGSGLSAVLFAKAGLRVYGLDFSPAMLELCRVKGIAVDLQQWDLLTTPWPYPTESFDHAVCCGVFHFIAELEAIFDETKRVLCPAGLFAFTTKAPATGIDTGRAYEQTSGDGLDIFAHSPSYLEGLLARHHFTAEKTLRCFVGDEQFLTWSVRKTR